MHCWMAYYVVGTELSVYREDGKHFNDLGAVLLTTLSNGNLPARYKCHYFWDILMVKSQKIVVCTSRLFVPSVK